MKSRTIARSGLPLVAMAMVLAGATTAAAQDHPPGHGMHQQMHGHPMMMAMMEGPQLALRERERLGLTADQVEQLEAVQERLRHAQHAPMERMQAVHRELSAAVNDELDEARARAALQRMAETHTEMALAMLRARQEARAVLTAEQREHVRAIAQEHMQHMEHMMREHEGHGMGPGMMAPGMMMCPMMMQHGMMQHGGESAPHRRHN